METSGACRVSRRDRHEHERRGYVVRRGRALPGT
jgi:hypothetical protein